MGHQIAETILNQLGGGRFIAMTGARNLAAGSRSLQFRIPQNGLQWNFVRITLEANDIYTMEFGRLWGTRYKVVEVKERVYADQLCEIFRRESGLELSL